MSVIDEIAAERQRQIDVEGWTLEHDDKHMDGLLARAAASYALAGGLVVRNRHSLHRVFLTVWPWLARRWKPKNPRRDLIRAGALIVAEIERLDRADADYEWKKKLPI